MNRKYLTLLEFFSFYINKIYTFSLFFSNGCNKNVMFLILKPLSNLFEFENTKFYINFLFLSYVFLANLFNFCGFSITWFSSYTPLKLDLNFLDMYFCLFFKGRSISSSAHFMFWNHLNVFGFACFLDLSQILKAFWKVFEHIMRWKSSNRVFSHVKWSPSLSLWRNNL